MPAALKLTEFLTQPESPQDSQVQNVKEIKAQETPLEVTGDKPVDRLMSLGKSLDSLKELMRMAETKFDDFARSGLEALKQAFPSQKTTIQKVRLPKQLVDFYGGDASKLEFGAQTLDRDPQKSDAQYEKLQKDVEMAKKYFGEDIHLHRIDYGNGKPSVAVVMGVDAEAFNAVISAERKKTQLEEAMKVEKQAMMMKDAPERGQYDAQNLDKASQMVIATNRAPEQNAPMVPFAPAQRGPSVREV